MAAEHSRREAAADIPAEVCERYESLSRRHVSELFTHHALTTAKEDMMAHLESSRLQHMHRYWCAAHYLTIGQIYLQENPLLREPLQPEHIKPRLLGHWGTSPGLSFIYVHLNRLIQDTDANVIYLTGPGHGGPAIVANVYLEGTYSEIYPHVAPDAAGLQRLFRQFATAGWHPEPRQRADPWLYARGRRTRLRPHARFRRCLR